MWLRFIGLEVYAVTIHENPELRRERCYGEYIFKKAVDSVLR
jgi:hypothetical protein